MMAGKAERYYESYPAGYVGRVLNAAGVADKPWARLLCALSERVTRVDNLDKWARDEVDNWAESEGIEIDHSKTFAVLTTREQAGRILGTKARSGGNALAKLVDANIFTPVYKSSGGGKPSVYLLEVPVQKKGDSCTSNNNVTRAKKKSTRAKEAPNPCKNREKEAPLTSNYNHSLNQGADGSRAKEARAVATCPSCKAETLPHPLGAVCPNGHGVFCWGDY